MNFDGSERLATANTQDDKTLHIVFRPEDKRFYLTSLTRWHFRTVELNLAHVALDLCAAYDGSEVETLCKWLRREYQRMKRTTADEQWDTPAAKWNHLYVAVNHRMAGFRPVAHKWGTHWVEAKKAEGAAR